MFLGSYLNPFGYHESLHLFDRLSVAILSSLVPAIFLAVSIGRLANHRFFTPEDIDGGDYLEKNGVSTLLVAACL